MALLGARWKLYGSVFRKVQVWHRATSTNCTSFFNAASKETKGGSFTLCFPWQFHVMLSFRAVWGWTACGVPLLFPGDWKTQWTRAAGGLRRKLKKKLKFFWLFGRPKGLKYIFGPGQAKFKRKGRFLDRRNALFGHFFFRPDKNQFYVHFFFAALKRSFFFRILTMERCLPQGVSLHRPTAVRYLTFSCAPEYW